MPYMAAITFASSYHTAPLLQLLQYTQEGRRWHDATKHDVISPEYITRVINHTHALKKHRQMISAEMMEIDETLDNDLNVAPNMILVK